MTNKQHTIRIGINEDIPDLAAQLGLALARQGHTVLISRVKPDVEPGQVIKALYLASTRLGIMDIHSDDLPSSLIAARDVPMDYHLVVFDIETIRQSPIHSLVLAVGLGRGTRTDAEVVAELLAAVGLGLALKRRLMWLLVEPDDVQEECETASVATAE